MQAMETELQTLGKANAAMSREIQRCLTRINSSRASGHGEGPQHILTKHPPSKQTPSDLTASKDSSSTNSPTVVSSGSKQPFLDGDANVSIHVDLASTKDAKAWPEGETPLHLRNGVTHPHIRYVLGNGCLLTLRLAHSRCWTCLACVWQCLHLLHLGLSAVKQLQPGAEGCDKMDLCVCSNCTAKKGVLSHG